MLMNKILRFSLLSLLAILTSSAYALKTVTIDFDNDYQTIFPTLKGVSSGSGDSYVADGDIPAEGITSAEIDGINVIVAPDAEAKTPSRIWGTSPRLRMYSGSFVVMSVGGYVIKKIEFTGHSTNFNITPDSGTLTDKVWEGNALGVVFTVAKNTQISSMVITLGGVDEEVVTWTVAGTAPLVDKSWDPADTSADMTSADGESFVYTKENITLEQGTEYKFKVVKNHAWDEAYPSSDYIVNVDETATYKIEITFNSKTKEVGFKSEKTGAPAEVAHNYSVIGTLVGNWDVDTEMTKGDGNIYKAVFTNVAAGNYEFKVRADKDWGISYPSSNYKLTVEKDGSIVTVTFNEETKTVEATVKAVEILTVAKALEIINALEDGKTTADEYIVKGFVTSITEISTKYGNATFVIADEKGGSIGLTVFRIKGIDGESITDENLLKVNDEVVVQGKLQKYVKNGEMTPELAQGGKIISITSSGDTPETQTLVWDFTKWSAATVAALKADAAASKISGWSDVEKAADAEAGADPTETSKDNCFWSVAEPNADGTLSANGEVIEELKGLVWNKAYTVKRSLAIAVNYPTALSDYAGPAYLWLGGGKNKIPCFTIPGVKAGSTVTMEVESHKTSDARGVELYTGVDADGLVDAATKIGDSFTPTTKDSHTWTIDADCDVIVYNTNGCHIYSIKVEAGSTGISTVNAQKTQNNVIYNLAGQKVGNDYKGIVIMNGKKFMQK